MVHSLTVMADTKSKKGRAPAVAAIDPAAVQELLEQIGKDPEVAKIYSNGFTLGLSNADAYLLLKRSGQVVAMVNLSFTLAKTLHQKLGRMVAEFESRSGQALLTTEEVDGVFKMKANDVH